MASSTESELPIQDGSHFKRNQVALSLSSGGASDRPWHKNPSTMISALALSVSLALGLFTIYDQQKERSIQSIADKKHQLRQILDKFLDAQYEAIDLERMAHSDEKISRGILVNASRQILLEEAQAAINDLDDNASVSSLIFLGYEFQYNGDFDSAKDYFQRALEKIANYRGKSTNKDFNIEISALRSIAALYMIPNTGMKNLRKSRIFWKRAVNLLNNKKYDYGIYSLANTYLAWSQAEFFTGNEEEAKELLHLSRNETEKISYLNPLRESHLTEIDKTLSYYKNPENLIVSELATSFLGEWDITYPEMEGIIGRAVVIQDLIDGFPLFSVEIFDQDTGILIRKFSGRGNFPDSNTVRFDWQGSTLDEQIAQPIRIVGTTYLHSNREGTHFSGSEDVLGYRSSKVVFTRDE